MSETVRCTLEELPGLVEARLKRLERRVNVAIGKAAIDGAHIIEPRLPVAFGDLRGSLHVEAEGVLGGHVRIVLDSPHAVPLEEGSRPHMIPIEPLIAWVKLRGMQGLTKGGGIRSAGARAVGNTTASNAHRVALAIQRSAESGATPVDAAEQIARAIQASIAKHGTPPHWMVRGAMPKIEAALGARLDAAVAEDD